MLPADEARRYVGLTDGHACPDCGHVPADTYETTIVRHARMCPRGQYGAHATADALRACTGAVAVTVRDGEDVATSAAPAPSGGVAVDWQVGPGDEPAFDHLRRRRAPRPVNPWNLDATEGGR